MRPFRDIKRAGFSISGTPFVRQYSILNNKWGASLCQNENQYKKIHDRIQKQVTETMQDEHLEYCKTAQGFTSGTNEFKTRSVFAWRRGRKAFSVELWGARE